MAKLFGASSSPVNVLAMTKLGPDLRATCIFKNCTALDGLLVGVGAQLLSKLRRIHEGGWFYGDGKPENFVTGAAAEGRDNEVFLIDFERAEPVAKRPLQQGHPGGGARYKSHNAHSRYPGYGDDIESLAYSIIHMAGGSLPWFGERNPRKLKRSVKPSEVCKGLPGAFTEFLAEARRIADKYGKMPNHRKLGNILLKGIKKLAAQQHKDISKLHFSWQGKRGSYVLIPSFK